MSNAIASSVYQVNIDRRGHIETRLYGTYEVARQTALNFVEQYGGLYSVNNTDGLFTETSSSIWHDSNETWISVIEKIVKSKPDSF